MFVQIKVDSPSKGIVKNETKMNQILGFQNESRRKKKRDQNNLKLCNKRKVFRWNGRPYETLTTLLSKANCVKFRKNFHKVFLTNKASFHFQNKDNDLFSLTIILT